MLAAARRLLVIIAALFVSAGHVACACVSSAAPVAAVADAANVDGHAHNHGDVDGGDEDAPPLPDCSHCSAVALAGDMSAKSAALPVLHKSFAIAASALPSLPRDFGAGILKQRLHWAAPPRRTPVSLKIRLRN